MHQDPLPLALRGEPLTNEQASNLALELFVVGYEGQTLPADYEGLLARGLAGAILFRRNLQLADDGAVDVAALVAHTASIHAAAARQPSGLPAVCSVDQEGGAVARLKAPFTVFPPMRRLGERGDAGLVQRVGAQLGRELLAAGFNVDYAPVLDIDTNPANPIIGDRSFSRDPREVARLAGALLDGLQGAGVLGCGKHFPGHGDTDVDSHLDLPVLNHGIERLRNTELVPFAATASQLQLVMTAHVLFPAFNSQWPATLAPQILGPLLRDHCGYRGVIVSDDLEMQGMAKLLDGAGCVVRGLEAGCDLFLMCRRRDVLDSAWSAATAVLAGDHGEALQARALDAIGRVRAMRRQLTPCAPSVAAVEAVLADDGTARLRRDLAGVTLG